MGNALLFYPRAERKETLHDVAGQADVTVSDLLRRMIDHCCQDKVLNELIPAMSGRITVTQGR